MSAESYVTIGTLQAEKTDLLRLREAMNKYVREIEQQNDNLERGKRYSVCVCACYVMFVCVFVSVANWLCLSLCVSVFVKDLLYMYMYNSLLSRDILYDKSCICVSMCPCVSFLQHSLVCMMHDSVCACMRM